MNPDHALLLAFVRDGAQVPRRIDTNPLAAELGAELLGLEADGSLRIAFAPDARFVQGNGVVQGGIVAAMLDFATAFVVLSRLPAERSAVTAALELQFLRPARAGRFVAWARLRRLGATLAFAAADLHREGDPAPVAVAAATLPLVAVRTESANASHPSTGETP